MIDYVGCVLFLGSGFAMKIAAERIVTKLNSRAQRSIDDCAMREVWAHELVDKQYRLYTWNDGKLQVLATVNGLLVAAMGFLFRDGPNNTGSLVLLLAAICLLFFSLTICLWRIRTFPRSGRTGSALPNVRSVNGILSFTNWEAYRDTFMTMTRSRFVDDCIRQVYGMAYNNRRTHLITETAVWCTLLGGLALAVASATQLLNVPTVVFHQYGPLVGPLETN